MEGIPLSVMSMLVAVLSVTITYAVLLYNRLVSVHLNVSRAWANIDVLLEQRRDEIAKLVACCSQYLDFERDVIEKVLRARSAVERARAQHDAASLGSAESELRSGLGGLFALAEAYPLLSTSTNFLQLQGRISQLEDLIADRRELYNQYVNLNNVCIQQFPALLFAPCFGFHEKNLLTFDAAHRADIVPSRLFTA